MSQAFRIVDKKTGKALTIYGDFAPTPQEEEELFDAYAKGTWRPKPPPQPFKIKDAESGEVLTVYGDKGPTADEQKELFAAYKAGTWKPKPAPTVERKVIYTEDQMMRVARARKEQGDTPEEIEAFITKALENRASFRGREIPELKAYTPPPESKPSPTSWGPMGAVQRPYVKATGYTPSADETRMRQQQELMALEQMAPQLTQAMMGGQSQPSQLMTPQESAEAVEKLAIEARQKLGVPESLARAAITGGEAGDVGIKVVGPLATAAVTRNPYTVGAAGAAADALVQMRQQLRGQRPQGFDPAQAGIEGVLTGVVSPAVAVRGVAPKTLQMAETAVTRAGQAGTMLGAGEAVRQLGDAMYRGVDAIREEGKQPFNLEEVFDVAMLGSLFGGAFGALETAAPAVWAKISNKKPSEAVKILRLEPKTPEIQKAITELESVVDLRREALQQRGREIETTSTSEGGMPQTITAREARAQQAVDAFINIPPEKQAEEAAKILADETAPVQRRATAFAGEELKGVKDLEGVVQQALASGRVARGAAIEEAVGLRPPSSPFPEQAPQGYSPAAPGAEGQVAPGERTELAQEARRVQAMEAFDKLPPAVKAEEAARVLEEAAMQQDRVIANAAGRMEENFFQGRLGSEETSPTPEMDRVRKADQRLAELRKRPGGATKEVARVEAQKAEAMKGVPAEPEMAAPAAEPLPELSPQAQRMVDRFGGADRQLLMGLAGGGTGFVVGWNTGEGLPPDQRLARALASGAGGAFTPTAIRRIIGMQGWANRVIKERGVGSGSLNTADPQILAALSVKGAALVGEGVKNFAEWGDKMVREFGDSIRPKLKEIWAAGQESDIIPNKLVDKAPERPPRQYETPAFKTWFGKSKMVNEDGTPMVMYHGANDSRAANSGKGRKRDFTTFKQNRQGLIFVTPDPEFTAIYFAKGERARIYPLYVKAENPFDYSNPAHVAKLFGPDDSKLMTGRYVSGRKDEMLIRRSEVEDGDWMTLEAISDVIRKSGFDSMYMLEEGFTNLAVFDPIQLKSATGNRGTYSLRNKDIRGFSTPAAMVPVAGAGAGAVVGASQGDTPEEKLRYAALGAAAGAGAGAAMVRGARGMVGKGISAEPRTGAVTVSKKTNIPTDKELKDAADSQRGAPETQMLRSQRAITDAGGPAIYADALEHIGDLAHRVQEPRYLGSGGAGEKIQRFMRVFFPGKNRVGFEQELEEGLRGTAEYRVIKKHPELEVEGEPRWMAYEKARTQYADEIKKNIAEGREEMIRQGREYAKVHLGENKPVTYAGKLGRDAAIALGEMDFNKLRNTLSELNDFYGKYADTPEIYSRQKPASAPTAAEAPKMDPRIAGFITKQLAIPLGSFAGGFTYGYLENPDAPPEQRLLRGLQWAALAGGVGYAVAKRSLTAIANDQVPKDAAKKLAPGLPDEDEVLAKTRRVFTPEPTQLSKEQELLTTPQAKLLQAFQNIFRPLSKMEEALIGRGEGVLLGDAASMTAGSVGKAEAALYLVNEAQKELIPTVSKENLNDYLFYRRVVDRLKTDAEKRGVSDWSIGEAQNGLNRILREVGDDTFVKLEEFARVVQTSADEDLKLLVRSGRLSQSNYDEIKRMNEFYAPFYVMEYFSQMDGAIETMGGKALDTTQSVVKAVKGIKDEDFKLLDIMAGFQLNKMRAQVLADKNVVMRRMAELSRVDTEHRFMKDLGTKTDAKYSGEIPKGWEVVNYMENGVQKKIAVLPEVAQAVKGMDTIRAGAFMTTLASFASPLRAGATGLNAGFQIVNIFKDAARLGIMSKYGVESLWKNPVDLFMFIGDLMVGFTHSVRSNLFGDKSQLYLDFLKSGAARSTLASSLVPDALARAAQQGDDKTAAALLKVPLRSFISGTEKFGNALEESIKLAGFRRGVRAEGLGKLTGKAYDDALERIAYEVRNYAGSPDFSKHGTHGKALNVLFMFANARIQGTAADLRRIIGRTGEKERNAAIVRLAAGIGTATGYLWYLNNQPENVEDYNKRSLSERNAYFLWPRTTETGDPMYYINEEGQKVREYLRFPKFEVVGMVANVFEAGLNYAVKRDPKGIMEMGKVALENLSPIPITGRNLQERMQSVASGLNPVFKAPLEIATNKSFFQQRDIVKQRLQGVRPEEQYTETTPKPFIDVARAMPEVAPDFLRSPLYLKQLTENFTGSMLTQFMRPQLEGRSNATTNPLVARFFAAPILDEQEDWDLINRYKTEQSTNNLLRQRAIDQYLKNSANYTPAQRMQSLAELLASDPERNAVALRDALRDRVLGITDKDKAIRSLPPEFRAQFLEERTRKMENPESRDAFYQEMIRKGLINRDTLKEIMLLRTAPEGKKTSFKEGKLYRDPTSGVMKVYRNGAFV